VNKAIIIVVFLFVMKPILPVLEYVIHYDYIIKELCENRAKPEMKCNGKCHLMKELAKASDNDSPNSQDKKTVSHEFEILFIEQLPCFEIVPSDPFLQDKASTNYSDLYFHESTTAFFHPPTV
jgi:hypothetical protein